MDVAPSGSTPERSRSKLLWLAVAVGVILLGGVALLAITSASWAQTDGVRPPSTNSVRTSLPQADREITLRKQQEFVAFDPQYQEKLAERIARARVLGKQVIQREVAGQNTEFSHQIVSEIIWLVSSTADFKRMDQRLDDLQASLDHPEREAEAEEQDPGHANSSHVTPVPRTAAGTGRA